MNTKRTYLIDTNSGYCCLNSTSHTWISALAWYAVISFETLNDLVYSPNRGACCPIGSAAPLIKSTH